MNVDIVNDSLSENGYMLRGIVLKWKYQETSMQMVCYMLSVANIQNIDDTLSLEVQIKI